MSFTCYIIALSIYFWDDSWPYYVGISKFVAYGTWYKRKLTW